MSVKNKITAISLLGLLLFFSSCGQYQVEDADQCLGVWKMVGDNSDRKSIVLMGDGHAEFNNISVEDIGAEGWGVPTVPAVGTWKLVSDGEGIEFWFVKNGAYYGQGGNIMKQKKGLELWFLVGDPDDYEWKRFRRVEPEQSK